MDWGGIATSLSLLAMTVLSKGQRRDRGKPFRCGTPIRCRLRWRAGFAAVDAGFGAPFAGHQPDGAVGGFVETEEVADDAAVEEGAVRVGVGLSDG